MWAIVTKGKNKYLFFLTVSFVTYATVEGCGKLSKFRAKLLRLISRVFMNEKLAHNSGIKWSD